MPSLGTGWIDIRADRKGLKKDLDKSERDVKRSAGIMQKELGRITFRHAGIAATAFAATYVLAMRSAISAASDLQETQGKFDVVFKGQQGKAEAWAQEMVDGFAMSEREAKQYLGAMQDLLVPMGMMPDAAGKMSNAVVRLAADLGSFNNVATGDVMADIQSAMVGNYETMKKYGVVLTANVVQQEALAMGLASTKAELTAADKAQAAFALITKGSTAAIGDQSRTMGSFANQSKQLSANLEMVRASLGDKLMPIVTEWVQDLNTWIKHNQATIDSVGDLARAVGTAAGAVLKLAGAGARFFNAWSDTFKGLGLWSAGTISLAQANSDASNQVAKFDEQQAKLNKTLKAGSAAQKDYANSTQESIEAVTGAAKAFRPLIDTTQEIAPITYEMVDDVDTALAQAENAYADLMSGVGTAADGIISSNREIAASAMAMASDTSSAMQSAASVGTRQATEIYGGGREREISNSERIHGGSSSGRGLTYPGAGAYYTAADAQHAAIWAQNLAEAAEPVVEVVEEQAEVVQQVNTAFTDMLPSAQSLDMNLDSAALAIGDEVSARNDLVTTIDNEAAARQASLDAAYGSFQSYMQSRTRRDWGMADYVDAFSDAMAEAQGSEIDRQIELAEEMVDLLQGIDSAEQEFLDSQRQLADSLGMTSGSITDWLAGVMGSAAPAMSTDYYEQRYAELYAQALENTGAETVSAFLSHARDYLTYMQAASGDYQTAFSGVVGDVGAIGTVVELMELLQAGGYGSNEGELRQLINAFEEMGITAQELATAIEETGYEGVFLTDALASTSPAFQAIKQNTDYYVQAAANAAKQIEEFFVDLYNEVAGNVGSGAGGSGGSYFGGGSYYSGGGGGVVSPPQTHTVTQQYEYSHAIGSPTLGYSLAYIMYDPSIGAYNATMGRVVQMSPGLMPTPENVEGYRPPARTFIVTGGYAEGGLAQAPSLAGEIGPEWVVPTYEPQKSRFLSDIGMDPGAIGEQIAARLAPLLAGRQQVVVSIDGEPVARAVVNQVRRNTAMIDAFRRV